MMTLKQLLEQLRAIDLSADYSTCDLEKPHAVQAFLQCLKKYIDDNFKGNNADDLVNFLSHKIKESKLNINLTDLEKIKKISSMVYDENILIAEKTSIFNEDGTTEKTILGGINTTIFTNFVNLELALETYTKENLPDVLANSPGYSISPEQLASLINTAEMNESDSHRQVELFSTCREVAKDPRILGLAKEVSLPSMEVLDSTESAEIAINNLLETVNKITPNKVVAERFARSLNMNNDTSGFITKEEGLVNNLCPKEIKTTSLEFLDLPRRLEETAGKTGAKRYNLVDSPCTIMLGNSTLSHCETKVDVETGNISRTAFYAYSSINIEIPALDKGNRNAHLIISNPEQSPFFYVATEVKIDEKSNTFNSCRVIPCNEAAYVMLGLYKTKTGEVITAKEAEETDKQNLNNIANHQKVNGPLFDKILNKLKESKTLEKLEQHADGHKLKTDSLRTYINNIKGATSLDNLYNAIKSNDKEETVFKNTAKLGLYRFFNRGKSTTHTLALQLNDELNGLVKTEKAKLAEPKEKTSRSPLSWLKTRLTVTPEPVVATSDHAPSAR